LEDAGERYCFAAGECDKYTTPYDKPTTIGNFLKSKQGIEDALPILLLAIGLI